MARILDIAAARAWTREKWKTARHGILLVLVFFFGSTNFLFSPAGASSSDVPANAKLYLPILAEQINNTWPDLPIRHALGGQIEQETCPSLTSKKCWNPRAELKTKREYGFGLGQITVTAAFNNFQAAKKLDAKLKPWKWEDRYDPTRQLRTLVMMDKVLYVRLAFAKNDYERIAFMLSAYNGGLGGVMRDRRLAISAGSDPNAWFGSVETYSYKSKTKAKGYGLSFYEINRGYVRNILKVRMQKYQSYFLLFTNHQPRQ